MTDNPADYTSVSLNNPRVERKPAITIAGVRRRHQMDGFDFAEFPRQILDMYDLLPGLTGRIGDRVYDVFWGMFADLGGYFDYLVGVEIDGEATLPDGYTALALPAQPYVIVANRLEDSPRDTAYTLWYEWLSSSKATHPDGDAPEFIYQHGEDYREDERNGPLDVYVPVKE
jgi:predicted transcriptional regulator YdeE